MSPEPLDELLAKLAAGDAEAAGRIFLAYEPYLRKVIRRQLPAALRSKLDSVDVMQSAWGDLLEGLRQANWHFHSPAQLQAFLVRVMRNRLIDRLREYRRPMEHERPLGDFESPEQLASSRPSPHDVAAADDLWQRLLDLCPPEHHEVLRLKREGASAAEIAERTGLHEGSVRRLLRQLAGRAALAPEGPEG
jgi:RNA polymerase sigma-70 factor (ECF subfamily)